MILGPDDPRGKLTPEEMAAARANTEKWNKSLGIKPMTPAQKKAYDKKLALVLDIIGWDDEKKAIAEIVKPRPRRNPNKKGFK